MYSELTYFFPEEVELTGSELFSESYFISPVETATQTVSKLEDLLLESGKLAPNDIPAAAAFLRSCLAAEPASRSAAADLFNSEWVERGNM